MSWGHMANGPNFSDSGGGAAWAIYSENRGHLIVLEPANPSPHHRQPSHRGLGNRANFASVAKTLRILWPKQASSHIDMEQLLGILDDQLACFQD